MAKKRKSKLQKTKDNPSSKYWKVKCDVLWSKIIRSRGQCEICGRSDGQLHPHHLISRSAVFFRHTIENGICLCARCHNYNYEGETDDGSHISAHATPWAFDTWMKKHKPEQYAWWQKNRWAIIVGRRINYQKVYETLLEQEKSDDR